MELPGAGELAQWRAEKDRYLRTARHSPLYGHESFAGLAYYSEDPAFRVRATVARPAEPEPVMLATSAGEDRLFLVYGEAAFELNGQEQRLTLFATPDAPNGPRLFVPFKDATSGGETYGAGRYLDPHLGAGGELSLDFNYAYHPYCAYSEGYRCPFPPPQNRLSVPVRAGERLPDEALAEAARK